MTRSERRPQDRPQPARIAVDLLGGDHAPAVVVDGALQACTADPHLYLLLVGPSGVAGELVAALPPHGRGRVDVHPVDGVVGMADPPLRGVRGDTSVRAADAKKGDNILVIVQLSGGNDGLNTVIPFADDAYHRNRSLLRIFPSSLCRF